MIAMALPTRPELLIADEPTTARTYRCRRKSANAARAEAELNMGPLFITHNLSIVRQLADRVAVMRTAAVEHNDCRALFSAPAHPYTQRPLIASRTGSGAAGRRCPRCCCRRTI